MSSSGLRLNNLLISLTQVSLLKLLNNRFHLNRRLEGSIFVKKDRSSIYWNRKHAFTFKEIKLTDSVSIREKLNHDESQKGINYLGMQF